MKENAGDIAFRIRGLREDIEISTSKMAECIGISTEEYEQLETGTRDIPASLLTEIAMHLKVDLGLLLTGHTPKMSLFSVTRRGRGASVDQNSDYNYENFGVSFKDALFEPFLVDVPGSTAAEPPVTHTHSGQEFNYILEGKMKLTVGDNEVVLEKGDSVNFNAAMPHTLQPIGGPVRFLAVISVK